MDYLWTPWRYRYLVTAGRDDRCVFCDAVAAGDDVAMLIVLRGKKNFVILNRFPYTSGHVMIVPYAHEATLTAVDSETLNEMMALAQRVQSALEELYHPEGYNLGLNIGRAAGAGIAGHLHLHVLPRWIGDTNFTTTIAETRVLPEELADTYTRLQRALATPSAASAGSPPARGAGESQQ
ncbi:MAG TPA: HIT domain-containing protein [Candidatus Acidoferrales bacterium]|jgi:ATP adenylyltransferase